MTTPSLLLLHGLGAHGGVWDRLVAELDWPGRVLQPDLRGHGHAPWRPRYSFGAMAADVAELTEPGEPVLAVGHSMGGPVAMALASGWYGVDVVGVVTIGVKVRWSDDEVAAIAGLAERPRRQLDSRNEAATWFLKLAGLHNVVDTDDPVVERGIVPGDGDGWTTSQDPRTVLVGPPPLGTLHAAIAPPVRHTCGAADPMVDVDTLSQFDPNAVEIADAGHNAMVERPAAVAELLAPWR